MLFRSSADDTADADLELLEREAARARAAQWATAHAHDRGGSPDSPDALAALLEAARTAMALLEEARTAVALLEVARTATVADGSMESAAFTGSVALSP